jgi:predicted acylesterase/phospholipase RssA
MSVIQGVPREESSPEGTGSHQSSLRTTKDNVHAALAQSRPLRLLSLGLLALSCILYVKLKNTDGGGIRGLSSLIILRRIMYTIEPTDDLYAIMKPCDYFDMICGTSTGGLVNDVGVNKRYTYLCRLIAIMLGRLHMGVQECIDEYSALARNIFQEKPLSFLYPKSVAAMLGTSRFSGDKLAEAVKRLVESKTGSRDTMLLDTREDACKVSVPSRLFWVSMANLNLHCRFVSATRTANTELALLRSYRSEKEDGSLVAIWQAARATSAAPTFFPPISFGNPLASYVDGALLHNNPIRLLIREALHVWGSDAALSCVVSIGTGAPPARKLGSMGHQVLLACAKLATHAENIARNFEADQGDALYKQGKYFRFNVTRGLQDVKLEEWQSFDLVDAATKAYLNEILADIQACSEKLKVPMAGTQPGTSVPIPTKSEHCHLS